MSKVLVIGGGGREHAIVRALSLSPSVDKIFAAPGNAGIAQLAECVDIGVTDFDALIRFVRCNDVDLTVVGPEKPLALGIVDRFNEEGLVIFGPSGAAARIESSKVFANDLMRKYSIPTADYAVFDDYEAAMDYVRSHGFPAVIKYEGLAAGKGVVVADSLVQASSALEEMLVSRRFGAGRVVIESFLSGDEFSFMCCVNGSDVYPLALAQDHKRAFDGGCGPNTGGMGAYSPVPFVSEEEYAWCYENIMCAAAEALVKEGCPFKGLLYGGLIKTASGFKVVEFNARFGDPETEVVLNRFVGDFYDLLFSVAVGRVPLPFEWSDMFSLGVVLVSDGYPGPYESGFVIDGLDSLKDSVVYHMGTQSVNGSVVSMGGRVLIVTGMADSLIEVRDSVYRDVAKIGCANLRWREDIARRSVLSNF